MRWGYYTKPTCQFNGIHNKYEKGSPKNQTAVDHLWLEPKKDGSFFFGHLEILEAPSYLKCKINFKNKFFSLASCFFFLFDLLRKVLENNREWRKKEKRKYKKPSERNRAAQMGERERGCRERDR